MRLDEEDPEILERFVKFLYTGDFDENIRTSSVSSDSNSTSVPTPSSTAKSNNSAVSIATFRFERVGMFIALSSKTSLQN